MFQLFLKQLPSRLVAPFRGYLWLWHIAAMGVTAALVFSGFDWWFFEQTRSDALYPLIMLAGIGGFFVPVLVPVALYEWGNRIKDHSYVSAAIGVAQATIVAWIIIAVYKTFTGRIQPEFLTTLNTVDISRNFQFGFFEHGIFWGWPSHHAAVAAAVATVLCLAFPNRAIRFVALLWGAIVAVGAAVGFHWFSDALAGVIVGVVVGVAIWRDIKAA
jgi:membrane-associated phospholipid phosphatase